ncbi:hypothetical protein BKA70DRAFT_1237068 [Coprinopsis sp. MPI-PUGE-AT-0042]|nr:hypothetical protein BKA70DRAFT_1237068 [Coprinopsis sp. MPI-PUGE-AT-0042]
MGKSKGKGKAKTGARNTAIPPQATIPAHHGFFGPLAPPVTTAFVETSPHPRDEQRSHNARQTCPSQYAQATAGTKRPTAHLETPAESPHPTKKPHVEAGFSSHEQNTKLTPDGYGRETESSSSSNGQESAQTVEAMAVDEFDYDACYDSEGLEYLDDEERTSLTAPLTPPDLSTLTPLAPVASLAKTPANLTFGTFPTRPPSQESAASTSLTPQPNGESRPSHTAGLVASESSGSAFPAREHIANPFVDIDDGPMTIAHNHAPSGTQEEVTYYDGELPPHQIDRDDILESVPKETKEEWVRIPTNKVLVYFGSDKVVSDCLSRVEEIAHEVNRLTGSARGIGIRHIKMYPGQGPLILRDTVQPYLIHNLLPRQKEILVQKRMTNSNRAWIFFFRLQPPNPYTRLQHLKDPHPRSRWARPEGSGWNQGSICTIRTAYGGPLEQVLKPLPTRIPGQRPQTLQSLDPDDKGNRDDPTAEERGRGGVPPAGVETTSRGSARSDPSRDSTTLDSDTRRAGQGTQYHKRALSWNFAATTSRKSATPHQARRQPQLARATPNLRRQTVDSTRGEAIEGAEDRGDVVIRDTPDVEVGIINASGHPHTDSGP